MLIAVMLIKKKRCSLARLFAPVTLIRLFFKKCFTYFCDIYVRPGEGGGWG